jgi:phosphate transport system permease protein
MGSNSNSPAATGHNPFAKRKSRREQHEWMTRWMLRAGTYAVLAATAAIFLHIIVKGAPIVLSFKAPFVNTEFLTKLPETLHVIEDKQGRIYETDPKGSDVIKQQLGDNFRQEKTVSYSGGGILGPIVGTTLLVVVCIVVALFLGIASAIYLNEYAKHGRFIEMVRLAILNLAGVPSVVFGLFGLSAFVHHDWSMCRWRGPCWSSRWGSPTSASKAGTRVCWPAASRWRLSFCQW